MSFAPLEFLFPVPSMAPAKLSPSHSSAVSPQSTVALQNVLKDNHTRWHIFFNNKRFHNHAAHRAIASWAIGADAETIQKAYERDCGYEKPGIEPPGAITTENFLEHLGDEKYYNAYMQFFAIYVKDKGIPSALEEFIFSRKANLGSNSTKANLPVDKHPQMLSRFLSGVLHPMIHTGYGAEFNLPGMIVEGLAQTAVHFSSPELLAPLSLFDNESIMSQLFNNDVINETGEAISTAFNTTISMFDTALEKILPKSLHLDTEGTITHQAKNDAINIDSKEDKKPGSKKVEAGLKDTLESSNLKDRAANKATDDGPHALTILARVLRDPKFAPSSSSEKEEETMYDSTIRKHGKDIGVYVNSWIVHPARLEQGELDKKIEEIGWAICVLYGVAGWTDGKLRKNDGFNADFFFMHLVTSSIFLPSLCALLSPVSQARLLKAYFTVVLVWAVARGQPELLISGFMADAQPSSAIPSGREQSHVWSKLLEEARVHHDEHVTKIIRALAGWAGVFGTRRARVPLGKVAEVGDSNGGGAGQNGGDGTKSLSNEAVESAGLGMGLGVDVAANGSRRGDHSEPGKTESGKRSEGLGVDLGPRVVREDKPHSKPENSRMEIPDDARTGAADDIQRDPFHDAALESPPSQDELRTHAPTAYEHNEVGSDGEDIMPLTELAGSQYLDGGLFLRVAVLTLGDLGEKKTRKIRRRGGMEEETFWDFKGFYDQAGWVPKAKL